MTTHRRTVWGLSCALTIAIFLTGCAEDEPEPPSVSPVSGEWRYDEMGVSQSTCPDNFYEATDSDVSLLYEGGNEFRVNAGTSSAFDCSLSGDAFECPTWFQLDVPIPGFDADVALVATAQGNFASDTSGAGENVYRYDCSGADCGSLETGLMFSFPCSLRVDFTLEAL